MHEVLIFGKVQYKAFEELAKDIAGKKELDLPIRESDANKILASVISLNEVKVKHSLGNLIIEHYGLLAEEIDNGPGEPKTLKEISLSLKISESRVSQLKAKALRILKHPKRSGPFKLLFRDDMERIIRNQKKRIRLLEEQLHEKDLILNSKKNEVLLSSKKMANIKAIINSGKLDYLKLDNPDFRLSKNAIKSLSKKGIETIPQLLEKEEEEIKKNTKGIGRKAFHEIKTMLEGLDVWFLK